MKEAALLHCPHSNICGICTWIQLSAIEQQTKKIKSLQSALQNSLISFPQEIRFLSPSFSKIRDRVDLIYDSGRYGFYQAGKKQIFEVESCLQMSPALFEFFQDLKKIPLPIQNKGSIRLRVSPSGERGLWLDFANLDVKSLLEEKTSLQALMKLASVEIGQKRKKLSAELKLTEPMPRHWTRTWAGQKSIDLNSFVGSFSQAGDSANQALIRELQGFFRNAKSADWVEFGSGQGNLTFPLAAEKAKVLALESDPLALQCLQNTLQENPEFQNKISFLQGDFQIQKRHRFQKQEGVLVNPPRPGLKDFLLPLKEMQPADRPQDFIYMSCYLESFLADAKQLHLLGYRIEQLSIVDQFPQTSHFEILSRWQL